jgi:hypothetical protein
MARSVRASAHNGTCCGTCHDPIAKQFFERNVVRFDERA